MAQRETLTVSLSAQLKEFIRQEVASGRFRNDSEVVREGLRLLAERNHQRRLEELVIEAIECGQTAEVTEEYVADLHRRAAERIERVRRQQRKPA